MAAGIDTKEIYEVAQRTNLKKVNPQSYSKKYRLYSPSALSNAYISVKESGMSVLKASKIYKVPENTLRDRVLGKINPETVVMGKAPLFSQFEEVKLVNHFKTMASYGYGYTLQESIDIASGYAVLLGKRTNDTPLTMKWVRGFRSRWPEVKKYSPRALEYVRAKMTKETIVYDYFDKLEQCLQQHGLLDKPHLVFNIDEKGVSVNHKPPNILAGAEYTPAAVTTGKGNTVTILGCGSASGVSIPPYFVFPGKRMNYDLLEGASPGAAGTVTETGWSNGVVFRSYLKDHFFKFVPGRNEEKIMVILDGHASHISVELVEWARSLNIIIFILPAHTSHILQPLDVSCYGAFETIYNHKCHKLMRETSASITRFNICKIACSVYTKALRSENLQSGFKKTGIYPVNRNAVPKQKMIPAEVFEISDNLEEDNINYESDATVEGGRSISGEDEARTEEEDKQADVSDNVPMLQEIEDKLRKVKSEKGKKKRKTVHRIVSGREITSDTVYKALTEYETGKKKTKKSMSSQTVTKSKSPLKLKLANKKQTKTTQSKPQKSVVELQAGPSHINLALDSDCSDGGDDDVCDEEKCCVCGLFTPKEVSGSTSLIFTKWAQCDKITNGMPCIHWTHLIYCTEVRVIRRGDIFLCPHCRCNEE